ncbi:Fc.00g056150.m01.CDS01 [Cosmosporella sp. VM-42]
MEEIEKLRKQLRKEQLLREAAEGRALKEQHQREEEQRRREAAEGRALEEQHQREGEQRRREAAEGRALKEQHQREEEQRRREEAEERASASQPLTLYQYLEACHSLSLAIKVVTDRSLTTQGDTTHPTGRIYPRRIIPWNAFAEKQEEVWNRLSFSHLFASQAVFPSQHQLDYVRSLLHPVSSELELRSGQRDVAENAVQKLMDETYKDPLLASHLDLDGTVTFESHTNLGNTDDSLSESMNRRARGKGNRADQFCIYRTSKDRNIPTVAIEYKPPHKLSRDEIVTGLVSEVQPDRDVINQEGEGFVFAARRLATAVVTQLFSYMVGKGIQYGYVCTGETYVFLHIPNDPSCVYYSVCVPSLDVQDGDETRLHRTAVAQTFAFILQAIRSPPPSQAWHHDAEKLNIWSVEYEDVLRSIPATVRKERRETPYKPQSWKGFERSPIRTRSRCLPHESRTQHPSDDDHDDGDDDDGSPSPTPNRTNRQEASMTSGDSTSSEMQQQGGKEASQGNANLRENIHDRPYCTHQCLHGLAFGGSMDKKCPNLSDHGNGHIDRREFLHLARHQLLVDLGRDADCMPLYISGSRGSLFKLRLSSHGYTLVAKGVEAIDVEHLCHENEIYDHLQALQGSFIPVCLGIVDLIVPYYYDSGVYEHFMFLSYGGRPVLKELKGVDAGVARKISTALNRLHQHQILHCDAEPRNVLYDKRSGIFMFVDLMLAELHSRPPLGDINNNGQDRKRKRVAQKPGKDIFADEMQFLQATLQASLS